MKLRFTVMRTVWGAAPEPPTFAVAVFTPAVTRPPPPSLAATASDTVLPTASAVKAPEVLTMMPSTSTSTLSWVEEEAFRLPSSTSPTLTPDLAVASASVRLLARTLTLPAFRVPAPVREAVLVVALWAVTSLTPAPTRLTSAPPEPPAWAVAMP